MSHRHATGRWSSDSVDARPGIVTLHDVAQEADVAVSTVSRALSNPDRVSRSTREYVLTVARRLGYQPNRAAGRTQMLALLVHDITNPYNFGLIRGAEAQARAAGYTLVLGDTQQSSDLESIHAERLRSSVDGLRAGREPAVRRAAARACWARRRWCCSTGNCRVAQRGDGFGGRQPADHRAPGGAGPPVDRLSRRAAERLDDDERWRALARCPPNVGIEIIRLGPFVPTLEQGVAAADVGLASGASALVAFNDLLAIGALQRLERRGIDVPGEISVVGYDDIFGSDFCHPPLTTVTGPVDEAGRTLVDLLLGTIAGARASNSPCRPSCGSGTPPGRPHIRRGYLVSTLTTAGGRPPRAMELTT